MANRIDLNGIDGLLAQLRARGESAVKAVERKALRTAGEVMAKDMRTRVHRSAINRRYHLQDNIVVSNVKSEDGIKFVRIGPNRKVSYRAHFPEFGTSNQPATPYIEPAFIAKKDEAMLIIAEEIRRGLRG